MKKYTIEQLTILHHGIYFPRDIRKLILNYLTPVHSEMWDYVVPDWYRIHKGILTYGYYLEKYKNIFSRLVGIKKRIEAIHQYRISHYYGFNTMHKPPPSFGILFIDLR